MAYIIKDFFYLEIEENSLNSDLINKFLEWKWSQGINACNIDLCNKPVHIYKGFFSLDVKTRIENWLKSNIIT